MFKHEFFPKDFLAVIFHHLRYPKLGPDVYIQQKV